MNNTDNNGRMEDGVGLALARLSGAYRQHMDVVLKRLGLHVGQEQALRFLWAEPGLTQGQLLERMGCSAPTLSNMLDRLEKSGFVRREPSPTDARSQYIALTDEGLSIEGLVREAWAREEARLTDGMTPEERLLFRRLLIHARRNLG